MVGFKDRFLGLFTKRSQSQSTPDAPSTPSGNEEIHSEGAPQLHSAGETSGPTSNGVTDNKGDEVNSEERNVPTTNVLADEKGDEVSEERNVPTTNVPADDKAEEVNTEETNVPTTNVLADDKGDEVSEETNAPTTNVLADDKATEVNGEESLKTAPMLTDHMEKVDSGEQGSVVAETPVVANSIVNVISNEETSDAITFAMSTVPDTIANTNSANPPLDNVSVNRDKDILTKFIEENPSDEKVHGDVTAKKIPEVNPPPEIQVYSAAVKPEISVKNIPLVATDIYVKNKLKDIEVEVKVKSAPLVLKKSEEKPPFSRETSVNKRQVKNRADGFSFKVCDMNRLRRYIVLGSEHNTYYSTPGQNAKSPKNVQNTVDNIKCVQALISQNRHEEVLETITEYSLSGRVAKEEPILSILALCAGHEKLEVRKSAFNRVVQICNIPTKLFRFLELTQDRIYAQRERSLPQPQKWRSGKGKRSSKRKKSSETSSEPTKKKKEEPEFKKVNKDEKKSSGWGRMRRKAVSRFYADEKKDAARLLYLVTKYKQRHNWSHKAVVGFAHPKMVGENKAEKDLVLKYCTSGYAQIENECNELAAKPGLGESMSEIINYIKVIESVSKLSPTVTGDEEKLLEILETYGRRDVPKEFACAYTINDTTVENVEGRKSAIQIVREHLPTGFLNSKKVWEALLCDMPMTALIRNLGKMSQMGLFSDPKNVQAAVSSLTNVHKLKTARIHPMKVLLAMKVYEQGKGEKGDLVWPVNQKIVKALDEAFYLSFKQPEVKENYKTGKKYMLCLDVSGSMTFRGCVGCELITPAMASVAMAWVTWNVEDDVELVAFGGYLEDMKAKGFKKDMLISEVLRETRKIRFGSTDCSLPMVHALKQKLEIDVFIVYTDSDTWAGRVLPVTALKNYNREMKRTAKLIVCGMESSGFTIADPQDPNMMDVVGFDANVPELISEFAKGNLSGACGDNCEDCRIKMESR